MESGTDRRPIPLKAGEIFYYKTGFVSTRAGATNARLAVQRSRSTSCMSNRPEGFSIRNRAAGIAPYE
jgi:hypothetical protein